MSGTDERARAASAADAAESALEFPPLPEPAPGELVPLADGFLWARVPVPGSLRHINVWLLDDGDGWTLVDTGMDLPEARAAWDGVLRAALGGRPLRRILCTHHHPDHAGLASFLAARDAAEVLMSAGETAVMRRIERAWHDDEAVRARVVESEAEGLAVVGELRPLIRLERYRSVMSGLPARPTDVADGATLLAGGRAFTARVLGGHTDAQVVLHGDGVLIAADQVLPRITSNVGIYPERADRDPVASYLASLDVLDRLAPETLVLPAHGRPFRGLHVRTAQLRAHHARALDAVERLLDVSRTATELAARLFARPLDVLNSYLAVGETLAHVRRLVADGRATVDDGPPRRYRAA